MSWATHNALERHCGEKKIVSQPQDKEWYMREMLVQDPDGHIIRFGHGIE
jgi:hypothetical protein